MLIQQNVRYIYNSKDKAHYVTWKYMWQLYLQDKYTNQSPHNLN